jgi:hypothetical protein
MIFNIKTKKEKAFPIIGIPDKEKLTVLLFLFKIRCAEIVQIYTNIRRYQNKAANDNWIRFFLKDRYLDSYITHPQFVSDQEREKLKKFYEEQLETLLFDNNSRFRFDGWDEDKEHNASVDLVIALKNACGIDIVSRLNAIKTYGVIENTISYLIKEYESFFEPCSDDLFIALFILNNKETGKKSRIIEASKNIDKIWCEIISTLRAALVYLATKNENDFNADQTFKEIEALESLTSGLAWVIRQKNSNDKESFGCPSKEDEQLLDKVREHPAVSIF